MAAISESHDQYAPSIDLAKECEQQIQRITVRSSIKQEMDNEMIRRNADGKNFLTQKG